MLFVRILTTPGRKRRPFCSKYLFALCIAKSSNGRHCPAIRCLKLGRCLITENREKENEMRTQTTKKFKNIYITPPPPDPKNFGRFSETVCPHSRVDFYR